MSTSSAFADRLFHHLGSPPGVNFVTRTVLTWVGRSAFYGFLMLSGLALIILLLPTQPDLIARYGFDIAQLHTIAARLRSQFKDIELLALALLPIPLHFARAFSALHSQALAPAELAVMRRLGTLGWVVEPYEDGGYSLYGPGGERGTCDHLRDLEDIATDVEYFAANLEEQDAR